jgi:hypothetical protein
MSGEALADVIAGLLRGEFSRFEWGSPYTWECMALPVTELHDFRPVGSQVKRQS